MKKIEFKNLEPMERNQQFDDEGQGIYLGQNFYHLSEIPKISLSENLEIYYLQKNMSEFFIYTEFRKQFCFELQQDVVNGKPQIQNIYCTIYSYNDDLLSPFLRFNKEACAEFLRDSFIKILSYLPHSEDEIKWYKNQIENLLIDKKEQPVTVSRNYDKRSIVIEYNGKTYSSQNELCREFNINPDTFRARLERGLSIDEAVNMPLQNTGRRRSMKGGRK